MNKETSADDLCGFLKSPSRNELWLEKWIWALGVESKCFRPSSPVPPTTLFNCQTTSCSLSRLLYLTRTHRWFYFMTSCSMKDVMRCGLDALLQKILRHFYKTSLQPKAKHKASCKPDSRVFLVWSSNQILLPIFGGHRGKEEGRAFEVWLGCWGPSLQNCLSIGAASVSSPSHQTGAWQRGSGTWERGSKVKLMPWMFDSSGPHCWRPRLIVKVQSSKRGAE